MNLFSGIFYCLLLIELANLTFTPAWGSVEETCVNDTDCLGGFTNYGLEPISEKVNLPAFQFCANGTCTCQSDQKTVRASFKARYGPIFLGVCVPELVGTGKPCEPNSTNDDHTCSKCSFGRFSESSGKCEGPFYGDVCRKEATYVSREEREIVYTLHTGGCAGTSQDCSWETNTCTCFDDLYYSDLQQKCHKLPRLGQNCSESKMCKDDRYSYGFTRCNENNTCVCKGQYEEDRKYCPQVLRGNCHLQQDFPLNSGCLWSYATPICVCHSDFHSDGQVCVPDLFGKKCDPNPIALVTKTLALQGLDCINGKYRCDNPTEEYYVENEDKPPKYTCVKVVGASCKSATIPCTRNSSCVDVDGDWQCQCDEGYSSTSENKCFQHAAFGGICGETKECNHYAGITCNGGVCQCLHRSMRFDNDLKKCVSPEGKFCGAFAIDSRQVHIACEPPLKCAIPKGPQMSGLKCIRD